MYSLFAIKDLCLTDPAVEASLVKGQVISKGFLVSSISYKKRTKTCRIVVKTNSFVRFLEEFTA